ncbi:MAG TPA: nodulation protein NfeD [Steroidobacteraceae bacterium]|jgi:membrane-bound serine protease (ClpP class)
MRAFLLALLLLSVALLRAETPEKPAASASTVLLLRIDGPIGPAISHYFSQGLSKAQQSGSALVILEMDTPGGLDNSMRDIIKEILASPIPVVTFVAPSGARAASAGTYILYASHVAAMAPATNLGSATPVQIGGESAPEPGANEKPSPDEADSKDKSKEKKDATDAKQERRPVPGSAMERKVVNDAVGYLRSLAQLRGRNVEWAERAVREGANLPASEALDSKVIDLIAKDVPDLLQQLDGRKLRLGAGEITLATKGLTVEKFEPDWRTELLAVITNPTIAYGLLLIGIYGLLFEGYNPGAVLPGVAGAICLLLALFAFQVLPVNFAGLALIVLGALLVVAEAFVPSFGALGVGGLIAFIIGSIMLFDTSVPGFSIALPIIAAIAFVAGLVLVGMVWIFGRARLRPVVTGVEHMRGSTAEVLEGFATQGTVRLGGELWNARTSVPLSAGQLVRVVRVDGLLLWVEPLNQ